MQASRLEPEPPSSSALAPVYDGEVVERSSPSEPEGPDEMLALVEALGLPGIPPPVCECDHSWEWHRAPEAMGACQFPVGYRAPFGVVLPLRIRPLWMRKRDGCPRYRPRGGAG
jgi:hypothetical protein